MRKIYRIQLSTEERAELEALTRRKFVEGGKVIKARALLLCDESADGPGMRDPEVMEATGMKPATLGRLRERCCEVGPLQALDRAKQARPSRTSKVTGEVEARLTALACSEAPDGCKRWTLNLLGARLVELELVDSISYETVRKALKKTSSSPG
jgi:Homeodomain-like domain